MSPIASLRAVVTLLISNRTRYTAHSSLAIYLFSRGYDDDGPPTALVAWP
jgi:hypothetical protein